MRLRSMGETAETLVLRGTIGIDVAGARNPGDAYASPRVRKAQPGMDGDRGDGRSSGAALTAFS